MTPASWLLYLAEVSFCTTVFALLYWRLFAQQPTFRWNRWYLLASLVGSFMLPLLPLFTSLSAAPQIYNELPATIAPVLGGVPSTGNPTLPTTVDYRVLLLVVVGLYAAGVLYRAWGTGRSLWSLYRLTASQPRTRLATGWLVQLGAPALPAFSLGPFIFLSSLHHKLSAAEQQLLLQHEEVHVRQHHTLDLLGYEVAGWLLWFNPVLRYLNQQLRQTHEYLADAVVTRLPGNSTRSYGDLLLRLATDQPSFRLTHTFSSSPLTNRILMLTKSTPTRWQKLRFLLAIPAIALAWVATSYAGSPVPAPLATQPYFLRTPAQGPTIRRIVWKGNTVVSAARLTQALGIAPGAAYDSVALGQRLQGALNYRTDNSDVTSLYMDQGYLFFSVEPSVVPQPNGMVDLVFAISEGKPARIGTITLHDTRNPAVATAPLLAKLPLHTGDLFSRTKLLESKRILTTADPRVSTDVQVNPIPVVQPNGAVNVVNLEFTLQPK